MTVKVTTALTTLKEVQAALKLGPVWCDITAPAANHIIVRNIRKFEVEAIDAVRDDQDWTSRFETGSRVGFEVQVLEGWRVPERVYVEK